MKSSLASVPRFTDDERFVASQLAREDLYFYARWMFLQRRGFQWLQNWHHQTICDALTKVLNGEILNLVINLPPRYSKTELAMVDFISYSIGRYPDAEFIYTSYSGKLAQTYSGEARDVITHEAYSDIFPGVLLSTDTKAKAAWKTTRGGALYSVGIGGSVTGMGAGKLREGFGGAIVIDDPHKADEARSDVIREGVIEWYQNTLQSRVNSPRTPKILIMQRLHERDLAGWLLSGGSGEEWHHLCLPAIAEVADEHRQPGDALWPAKHSRAKLEEMREAMPYTFAGQYQQAPASPEGNIFKPDRIEIVESVPADRVRWLTGWDFAATVPVIGKDPDWTAGLRLGVDHNGRYYISDLARMRGAPDEVEACLLNTAKRHGRATSISIPQDPGQAGKSQVLAFTKMLAGFRVSSSPESGDKITRAEPFAAQVNVGNVSMLKAEWNNIIIDEMRAFPNGSHDDTIDAGSRAFAELAVKKRGFVIPPALLKRV